MKILTLTFLFLCIPAALEARGFSFPVVIKSSCVEPIPVIPTSGSGCSVPENVDINEFGDNSKSSGVLIAWPRRNGLYMDIQMTGLSKPDLVLTAWLVWTLPGLSASKIFEIANSATPLAPSGAAFTTGLGKEPNEFEYTSETTARLQTELNFNPSLPNEGPLARKDSFQKDVPGIQDTEYKQFKTAAGGFTPTSSTFLRKYDPKTGFEVLDAAGLPELVRSPQAALGIAIIAHTDKTTHGISPGDLVGDHFEVMSFVFSKPIGSPIHSA